jgi:hypothetical protein
MSTKQQTKKSLSSQSPRLTRKTVRIDSTKNLVKEYTKVDPSQRGELWTTKRDVEKAKEDAGILSLRHIQDRYKDNFGRHMAMKELEERKKKGKTIKNHVKKTIQMQNLRSQLLLDVKTLAKLKYHPHEDVIQLKRQPPVDKSILETTKNILESLNKKTISNGTRKSGGYKIIKKRSERTHHF